MELTLVEVILLLIVGVSGLLIVASLVSVGVLLVVGVHVESSSLFFESKFGI